MGQVEGTEWIGFERQSNGQSVLVCPRAGSARSNKPGVNPALDPSCLPSKRLQKNSTECELGYTVMSPSRTPIVTASVRLSAPSLLNMDPT